jgi:hypothetical protein
MTPMKFTAGDRMARGKTLSRRTRAAGAASLLAVAGSVAALTGAAFFTVNHASCPDPGNYVRHDSHVELIGGCVDPAKVPGARPAQQDSGEAGADRGAVHRRDDRLGAVDDVVDEVAGLLEHPDADREVVGHVGDEVEVAAGGERLALAAHDDDPGVGVGVDHRPDVREVAVHLVAGGIELAGGGHDDLEEVLLGTLAVQVINAKTGAQTVSAGSGDGGPESGGRAYSA